MPLGFFMSNKNSLTSSRENLSWEATYDQRPFAQGAFRYVSKGKYTNGERNKETCVVKWFKSGHVFDKHFYNEDIKAVEKALEIITLWNEKKLVSKQIVLNIPTVWHVVGQPKKSDVQETTTATTTTTPQPEEKQERVLVEPFIKYWEKFNSNSGWVSSDYTTHWPQVMQALSHFSYHVSSGEILLCDLQGGCYQKRVVLTDPVILSTARSYGVTDLGFEGISNFFATHVCNKYCEPGWKVMKDAKLYFQCQKETSMSCGNTTNCKAISTLKFPQLLG